MYNVELNLINIYFNAESHLYTLKDLLLNQEYVSRRSSKTSGHFIANTH